MVLDFFLFRLRYPIYVFLDLDPDSIKLTLHVFLSYVLPSVSLDSRCLSSVRTATSQIDFCDAVALSVSMIRDRRAASVSE